MDYTIDQSYHFYVKKCTDSDWCPAGTDNATHQQVYLTFGTPIGPWGPGTTRACWSRVLKDACEWMPETGYDSAHERDAMKTLVAEAYRSGGKVYAGGQSHYGSYPPSPATPTTMRFRLWDFIPQTSADCQDMSLWWQVLCHSLGTNAYARRIGGTFSTQSICPVGSDPTQTSAWNTTSWNFHHVGWDNNVFDPCEALGSTTNYWVAQDEDIGTFKTDLWSSGPWSTSSPYNGFALGSDDPFWTSVWGYAAPSEVD